MTNAPLSWTVERASNLLEQEVVWSCGWRGGSDLQVARITEGRTRQVQGAARAQAGASGMRHGGRGGHGVSGLPEGTLPVQQLLTWKESAPRGHWVMAGDICGCHTLGGGQGCCSTPRRAQEGPPQRMIWPQMPLVSRLRSP